MRCWLCVAAAAAAASVAQKSEPRLLYPIMIQGGPNNQYQQFLESMLLAKALRRKIVLAPFLSWAGGGDRSRVHAFEATFDVDAVRRFVDVVSTKDMGEASTTIVTAGPNSAWRGKRELRTICGMARIRGGWCEAASHAPHLSRRSTPAARQRCRQLEKPWGSYVRCLGEPFDDDRVLGAALWASMKGLFGRGALRTPRTLAAVRALRRAPSIRDKAAALRRTLFGDRPYLCAHQCIKCRGASRIRGLYAIDATPIVASTPSTRRLSDGVTVWVS